MRQRWRRWPIGPVRLAARDIDPAMQSWREEQVLPMATSRMSDKTFIVFVLYAGDLVRRIFSQNLLDLGRARVTDAWEMRI